MTEQAFREEMVARVASLVVAVEALKDVSEAQWARIEDRFKAQEDATGLALTAAEKANDKAEILASARSAQQDERISDLSTRAEKGAGRGEGSKATLYGVGFAISTAAAAVTIIILLSQ